jgi:hypothetical protein
VLISIRRVINPALIVFTLEAFASSMGFTEYAQFVSVMSQSVKLVPPNCH